MLWLNTSGRAPDHGRERLLLDAEEVGREHLDVRLGELRLERADRRREVAGPPVGQVVAVDRGHDDVGEPHRRRRLSEAERLERVGRTVGPTRVDVAVAAGPGARVAQDLERRRPASPALRDVRAAGLFAHGHEARPVEELAHVPVLALRARRADLHPRRPAGPLGDGKRGLHRRQSTDGLVCAAPPSSGCASSARRDRIGLMCGSGARAPGGPAREAPRGRVRRPPPAPPPLPVERPRRSPASRARCPST